MDGFGAYAAGPLLDTITKCTVPLTYITPQVSNPKGNIITDTLNWTAISGTFTAAGNEKYLLLGNFLDDNNVATDTVNPQYLPGVFTDVCIDDVSIFELDAPAYAGRDTLVAPGDSVYLGSPRDFATDRYCQWYHLPDMTTAIDTAAGIWVTPTLTTTYVVRQQLWCSGVKWDTVTVEVGFVGLPGNTAAEDYFGVEVFPNPAKNIVILRSKTEDHQLDITITDLSGRRVFSQHLRLDDYTGSIQPDLDNGAYIIIISNADGDRLSKRLIVSE